MKNPDKTPRSLLITLLVILLVFSSEKYFGQQVAVNGKIERLLPDAAYNDGCLNLEIDSLFSTNFKVTFINVDTHEDYHVFTDNDGYYVIFLEEGTYDVYPEICPEDSYMFGISTYDITIMDRHILEIDPIVCPLLRIAADINDDFKIDSFDILDLRKLILGSVDSFEAPNWRFLSIDYIKPYSPPWDCCFVRKFWEFPALPNEEHPFHLVYERDPFYLTSDHHHNESWTDKYFRFTVYDGCNPRVPDFIAVKTGDIDLTSGFDYPYSGGGIACFAGTLHDPSSTAILSQEMETKGVVSNETGRSNDTTVIEVNVFLEGVDSLIGYQFGLRIPEQWIQKIIIKRMEEGIELSDRDFNLNEEFLEGGRINHLWLSDSGPVNALNGVFLFSLELHLLASEVQGFENLITFDNTRIPLEIIGYSNGSISVVNGNIYFTVED